MAAFWWGTVRLYQSSQVTSVAPADVREPRCQTTRSSPIIQAVEMTSICDDVYAESGLEDATVDALKEDVEVATRNLQRYFGELRATPLILFCRSATCKIAFGAPPTAASSNDMGFASAQVALDNGTIAASAVVVTAPVEGTARILTHELVHAEMKEWATYDSLPTWFNEGTATFIAQEPRCELTNTLPTEFDVTRLKTKAKWQRHLAESGKTRETYCAARQEVEVWMQRFETDSAKGDALKALLTAVRAGTAFEEALRLL